MDEFLERLHLVARLRDATRSRAERFEPKVLLGHYRYAQRVVQGPSLLVHLLSLLVTLETWASQSKVVSPDLRDRLDVLWEWTTITSESFPAWCDTFDHTFWEVGPAEARRADKSRFTQGLADDNLTSEEAGDLTEALTKAHALIAHQLFGGYMVEYAKEDYAAAVSHLERLGAVVVPLARFDFLPRRHKFGHGESLDPAGLQQVRMLIGKGIA